MKRLILHIGNSKCGSSTIQSHLSSYFTGPKGVVNHDGDVLRYAAMMNDGRVLMGEELKRAQSKSVTNYVSSAVFRNDSQALHDGLLNLTNAVDPEDTLILSNEGWSGAIDSDLIRVFDRLGVPVDVFYATRPPAEWLNSAWWQWGVWTGEPVRKWAMRQIGPVLFFDKVERWRTYEIVQEVEVVDISQGILKALYKFLKVDAQVIPETKSVNAATNFDLLRHLVNNKEKYGRTIHSPRVEFALNRILNLPKYSPPFVMPIESTRMIMERSMVSNRKLVDIFSASGLPFDEVVARRYLDAEVYNDVVDVDEALRPAENDAFIGAIIHEVLRANGIVIAR